jgi:hypothetical protein
MAVQPAAAAVAGSVQELPGRYQHTQSLVIAVQDVRPLRGTAAASDAGSARFWPRERGRLLWAE